MTTPSNTSDTQAQTGFRIVEVSREPVELYKILKFDGMTVSGGQAKAAVASGQVRVNGEVETQKRKKIISGDTIEFNDEKVRIMLALPISADSAPGKMAKSNEKDRDVVDIKVRRDTDLSAEVVWEELRHFDRLLKWIPGGDASTISVQGEGVGAVRDLQLATQGYVQHRLVAFDDEQRMFSYELTGGMPVGMQAYTVIATVTPSDEDHCSIRFAGKMTADDSLDAAEVGRAVEVALGNLVTGAIARLKGAVPDFAQQPNEDWQLRRDRE